LNFDTNYARLGIKSLLDQVIGGLAAYGQWQERQLIFSPTTWVAIRMRRGSGGGGATGFVEKRFQRAPADAIREWMFCGVVKTGGGIYEGKAGEKGDRGSSLGELHLWRIPRGGVMARDRT